MLTSKLIGILVIFTINPIGIHCKETTCIINGKRLLNKVNERFLSFSIDPATLLTGLNSSSTSTLLARHLSPAFLRISGPSTQYVQFSESEEVGSPLSIDSLLTVTPQMWKSFNQWAKGANLTPIFAVNDKSGVNGGWDPKAIIPFLDINYKMDFDCYWQLGYDCGYKSLIRYKEDLMTLKHVLEAYPPSKVVGSNLRSCTSNRNIESVHMTLEDLEGVADAVMWEQKSTNRGDISINPSHLRKSYVPVWLALPKEDQPMTFASGLLWAKQLGEAAKQGYEVVFRQPRLHELFADTPVFWISLIHKTLMGRNVLDVRTNSLPALGSYVYAHCSKRQNRYSRQGAMTVFVVNTGNYEFIASIRVASNHPKSIDVQSYIITSEDSTSTYLNGEKLTLDILQDGQLLFIPKLRRARVNKLLNLNVPGRSVGFFVLPGARIPVCISREDETNLLMRELEEDQNISVFRKTSDEKSEAQSSNGYKGPNPLSELYNFVKQELNTDEQYYKTTPKSFSNTAKQPLALRFSKLKKPAQLQQEMVGSRLTTKNFRQYLANKSKKPEWKRKDDTAKVEIIFTERPARKHTFSNHSNKVELELTKDEIRKILTDRAKSQVAAKNIDVTSGELQTALTRATENLIGKESTTLAARPKHKRFVTFNALKRRPNAGLKRKLGHKRRGKREINMELLRRSMQEKPTARKETTIRKFSRNSEELSGGSRKTSDIFPTLAESWERDELPSKSRSDFSNSRMGADLRHPTKETQIDDDLRPGERYVDDRIQFLMGPGGLDSEMEDDVTNYHTFYENLDSARFLNPSQFENEWKTKKPQTTNDKTIKNEVKAFLSKQTDKLPLDEAVKHLNNPRRFSDDDYGSMFPWEYIDQSRFKRDTNATNITNADIKNYKKFMIEQLRVMKHARKQDEDKNSSLKDIVIKSRTKPIQIKFKDEDSSNGEHLHIVIGKPYDPQKVQINERRRDAQVRLLKQWLQTRKRKNEKIREKKKEKDIVDETLEKSRRRRAVYDLKVNGVYVPKVRRSNTLIKQYKLNKMQKKAWKPQDLRKIRKVPSYSTEDLDNREFLHRAAPLLKNKFREKRRHKRNVNDDVNSSENMIDDHYFNSSPKLKGHFKDFDDYISHQTISPDRNLVSNISTELISETIRDNKSTKETSTTSLEQSQENISSSVTATIDYCTSDYKKNLHKEQASGPTSEQSNVDQTNLLDTIIIYMNGIFQNIFGNISGLIGT